MQGRCSALAYQLDLLRSQSLFRLLARYTPVIAVDHDGTRLFVSTRDHGVGVWVFRHGDFETQLMSTVVAVLKRMGRRAFGDDRDLFLDIGANIGTATVQAIRQHGAQGGIAFEPDATNADLLRHNLLANGLTDVVTVVEAAVSDVAGSVEFEISPVNFGDHRVRVLPPFRGGALGEKSRELVTVRATTLDEQIERGLVDLDHVGIAWVDTQGHEAHVLAGAKRLRESDIPVVLEYWPYGLRAAGALDRIKGLITESYPRYVTLIEPFAHGEIVWRSTGDLSLLDARLGELGFVEILLVRDGY